LSKQNLTLQEDWILHWGQGNPCYQYRLGDEGIESSPEEEDLGYW